jgi:hypothetical protein
MRRPGYLHEVPDAAVAIVATDEQVAPLSWGESFWQPWAGAL